MLAGCDAGPAPVSPSAAPAPPTIASLSPEVTRLLLELGAAHQIVAADAVSLSSLWDENPVLRGAVDLGALANASVEALARLAPDVTIGLARPAERAFAAAADARDVRVTLLAPRDANGADAAVLRIGRLVGRETRARSAAARITRDVARIATRRDGLSRRRVALLTGCAPLTAVGGAGLVHEALELAGAENVFHELGREERAITRAELAERAPDVVLDATGRKERTRCFEASAGSPRVGAVPEELAFLPALDLLARVETLYGTLYSEPRQDEGGPAPPQRRTRR